MLITNVASVALGLALLALPGVQQRQGESSRDEEASEQKDRAAVEEWIRHLSATEAAKPAQTPVKPSIEPVRSKETRQLFPDERYYTVHFMQYPRAVPRPQGLGANTLVCVRPDGSVNRIKDLEELKKLYATKLPPVHDAAQAQAAASVFLRLALPFHHHGRGRYTFEIPEDGVVASRQGDRWTATGKAIVKEGGEGQVTATLTFDASGKLKPDAIKVNSRLRALPGGRP